MKDFRVEAIAQTEFEEAAGWYETQREGLGFEFIAGIDRVLIRIAHEDAFPTAPMRVAISTHSQSHRAALRLRRTSMGRCDSFVHRRLGCTSTFCVRPFRSTSVQKLVGIATMTPTRRQNPQLAELNSNIVGLIEVIASFEKT